MSISLTTKNVNSTFSFMREPNSVLNISKGAEVSIHYFVGKMQIQPPVFLEDQIWYLTFLGVDRYKLF